MPTKNLHRVVGYVEKPYFLEIRRLEAEEDKSRSEIVRKLVKIGLKHYYDGGDGDEENSDVDWSKIPPEEGRKMHEWAFEDEEQ